MHILNINNFVPHPNNDYILWIKDHVLEFHSYPSGAMFFKNESPVWAMGHIRTLDLAWLHISGVLLMHDYLCTPLPTTHADPHYDLPSDVIDTPCSYLIQ